MDNTILMLHPLSFSEGEEFSLVPAYFRDQSPLPHNVPSPSDDSCDRPKKRLKTTAAQVAYMEDWFKKDPLPTRVQREKMVQQLGGVTLRQVEVWFQNRRAKHKKTLTSPQSPVATTTPPLTSAHVKPTKSSKSNSL